jgi:hypothetical protein
MKLTPIILASTHPFHPLTRRAVASMPVRHGPKADPRSDDFSELSEMSIFESLRKQ